MAIETQFVSTEVMVLPPIMVRLAAAFEREGILYSHWKSNLQLGEPAGGDGDYDLLVDRGSFTRAVAVLAQYGFKEATTRWGADSPGIHHYYGFDATNEQLVHVHLFSMVLTGESFVKNHLFPFDAMLLDNVSYFGPLRVTDRSAELVIFILRNFIKYGSLPDLMVLRHKSASLRDELLWLEQGADFERTLWLLSQHVPVLDQALFVACIQALKGDQPLFRRIILARKVRQQLKVYARHGFWGRLFAYASLLFVELRRRVGTKRKNKRLRTGGAVIAFVGAEATGKSTLVAETACWLGSTFSLKVVHAGKPPATVLTAPASWLLPLIRRRFSSLRTNTLDGHIGSADGERQASGKKRGAAALVYAMRAVILAWERRQLLVRARRDAANGDLVICDRYPSDTVGAMDSPRLPEPQDQDGLVGAITAGLARLEQRLYRQIAPPDTVLRLHVSIDTAQRRNRERVKDGKESDEYVASRHRQIREWHKSGTKYVYDVDTEKTLAETIANVKKAIWDSV